VTGRALLMAGEIAGLRAPSRVREASRPCLWNDAARQDTQHQVYNLKYRPDLTLQGVINVRGALRYIFILYRSLNLNYSYSTNSFFYKGSIC
jgi:hypothetical protein